MTDTIHNVATGGLRTAHRLRHEMDNINKETDGNQGCKEISRKLGVYWVQVPENQIVLQEVGFGPASQVLCQLRQKVDVNPLVSWYSGLKDERNT